jgi:hypothetical protein
MKASREANDKDNLYLWQPMSPLNQADALAVASTEYSFLK